MKPLLNVRPVRRALEKGSTNDYPSKQPGEAVFIKGVLPAVQPVEVQSGGEFSHME